MDITSPICPTPRYVAGKGPVQKGIGAGDKFRTRLTGKIRHVDADTFTFCARADILRKLPVTLRRINIGWL